MHGNDIVDSNYEINEYKPYRARAHTTVLTIRPDPSCGTAWSRNRRRLPGICSSLISGLYESLSLSVGMIIIVIVRWLMNMEHLNYACHP